MPSESKPGLAIVIPPRKFYRPRVQLLVPREDGGETPFVPNIRLENHEGTVFERVQQRSIQLDPGLKIFYKLSPLFGLGSGPLLYEVRSLFVEPSKIVRLTLELGPAVSAWEGRGTQPLDVLAKRETREERDSNGRVTLWTGQTVPYTELRSVIRAEEEKVRKGKAPPTAVDLSFQSLPVSQPLAEAGQGLPPTHLAESSPEVLEIPTFLRRHCGLHRVLRMLETARQEVRDRERMTTHSDLNLSVLEIPTFVRRSPHADFLGQFARHAFARARGRPSVCRAVGLEFNDAEIEIPTFLRRLR